MGMVRSEVATVVMGVARSFGRTLGCELVVDASETSLEISMEKPDTQERAWDSNLYQSGNLFIDGYANPVRPEIVPADDKGQLDDVDVTEGETDADESEESEVGLIPSHRYQTFMSQQMLSELMNPREQWKLIVYAVLGVAALGFIQIIVTLYATGSF